MTDWKEYKVSDLLDSKSLAIGDGYRAKNSELSNTGLPFARAGNINEGFDFANADCFPVEDISKVGEKVSRVGDIVFTSKGTVGRFAYVDESALRFVYSPQLCYWRSLNKKWIHPRFLFYWMQGKEFYSQVDAVKGQTDMADYVSLSDQRRMKITLPPLPEQQAIAEVLSSLDDKIDLLHRQNETLEALAETLFRQWFVEEAAESWESGIVTDLVDLNPRRSLSKETVAPYLEMSNLSNELYHPHDWYDRIFTSGTKFINGDTLLARITPCLENGKTAYVDFLKAGEVGWGSTEFIVMRTREPLHPFFSYILARHSDFRNFAIGCMVGSSGRQRADVDNLATYEMKLPPPDVIKRFNKHIEPSLQKMKLNNDQIRTLTRLRDALLPKLMSGEMRVDTAEAETAIAS
ncbi:MAG: restriction endonuclease subunit S [Pyrinomonadaceae bacterium]|nr:restriction endonuclease subunit S [Pyrinomonadaceae bacterium]